MCAARSLLLLHVLVLVASSVAAAAAGTGATQDTDSPLADALPDVPECPRHFTREFRPVCASNGETYNNLSIFTYHQCVAEKLRGEKLTLRNMTFCDERREL